MSNKQEGYKMSKQRVLLSAEEMLIILNKQWATRNDIKAITSFGETKSVNEMKKIRDYINKKYNNQLKLPKCLVPMKEVVEYYKIDVKYLKQISNKKNKE